MQRSYVLLEHDYTAEMFKNLSVKREISNRLRRCVESEKA